MGDKGEVMKIDIANLNVSDIIKSYKELKSSYKVAEKYNTSPTQVKRVLKELNVLRTQSLAATERNLYTDPSKMKGHKKSAKMRSNLKEAISKSDKRKNNIKHGKAVRKTARRLEEFELIRLKKEILKDCDYKCQNCSSNNKLVLHHILPYSFVPEASLDKENLMLLCSKCHLSHGHNGNWKIFNINLVTEKLMVKYSLHAERLNEMVGNTSFPNAKV